MSTSGEIRLLVVDGDPTLRQRIVQELAARQGVTVVATAMGGKTGLPKIMSYQPDVVVVDLATEGVEGGDLVSQLRSLGNRARVVGLCAAGSAVGRDIGVPVLDRPADGADFGAWLDQLCARCEGPRAAGGAHATEARSVAAVPERPRSPHGPREPEVAAPASPPPSSPPQAPSAHSTKAPAATAQTTPSTALPPVAPRSAAELLGSDRPAAERPTPERRVPATAAAAMPVPPRASAAPTVPPAATAATTARVRAARSAIEVVGIGVSTGGPKALAVMLPQLPANLSVPVLIVQHMPPVFTASLAESLSRQCAMPVREARAGEPVLPGQILIAPGGKHMRVVRADGQVVIRITEDPPENSCRPAVDYLFRSLGEVYGSACCAVMMTGMGEDGFAGCRQLHALGARIVAQDEATCTVFGMPRGPIESGIVDVVAPLEQLAARVVDVVKGVAR